MNFQRRFRLPGTARFERVRLAAVAALVVAPATAMAGAPPPCCPSGDHNFTAAPASVGLGQAWPQTTDLSQASNFHAYRFARDGVQYVQVNDASGAVRLAAGIVSGGYFELPAGSDRVISGTAASGVTVYAGTDVKVAVQTGLGGELTWIIEVTPAAAK